MATKKKMLQAAAGQAGGAGLDITEVFSTYLYEGNGSTQTITNGIDLDGEGGLVWVKMRGLTRDHALVDTERGVRRNLKSNTTAAEGVAWGDNVNAFYSNGFLVGPDGSVNTSSEDYASWTFRKAPKFFDVVTYTGNGGNLTIDHNLGSVPGCIIIKCTSAVKSWVVYHRGVNGGSNPENYALFLNSTSAQNDNLYFQDTAPTSTQFFLGDSAANENGQTHVAYLFAHNDGDGGFGPDGDQDIIKCGSYTTDGNEEATIDLGWEPQWVLFKRTDSSTGGDWNLFDTMRGLTADTSGDGAKLLEPNTFDAELATSRIAVTPTGFKVDNYGASRDYIYMAIRRGPLAQPESGTEVFAIDTQGSTGDGQAPAFRSTFPVDTAFVKSTAGGGTTFASRLTGTKYLRPEETSAEYTNTQVVFDYMNGFRNNTVTFAPNHGYLWKRAPGFFDVVAYSGDGVAGRTVSHNLGVAPEMIWVKSRNVSGSWRVYHKDIGNTGGITINLSNAAFTLSTLWNDTSPTSTDFTLGTYGEVNTNGNTHIAYLFATVPGVSKVFSVTKSSGSDASVDCGFTSGPRFVMLKRTDSTGDWYVWDTERGIVAGNDPYLLLNSTAAEVTSTDYIDPTSNGFTIVNGGLADGDYIGYAVS